MKAPLQDQPLQFEPPILREKLGFTDIGQLQTSQWHAVASSAQAAWLRKAAGRSARTAPGQRLSKMYDDLSAIHCQYYDVPDFMVRN